jgi:hypothetical protein
MKLTPAALALIAGAVAAFLLLRPKPSPAAAPPGFFDRVFTLGDTVASGLGEFAWAMVPTHEGVKRTVEGGYADLVDYLRRVDPRPDPSREIAWNTPLGLADLFYDPMMDRWNYPGVGAAVYRWGPGEGW